LCNVMCIVCFVALQRSTQCTSVARHSSQHNITQHGMLPQHVLCNITQHSMLPQHVLCNVMCIVCFVALQRSTECTSIAGHSSQHNITQHGMLPQHVLCNVMCIVCFVALQRSTQCTSVARHSSQHNITQHCMLPQHPTGTAKLICDYF